MLAPPVPARSRAARAHDKLALLLLCVLAAAAAETVQFTAIEGHACYTLPAGDSQIIILKRPTGVAFNLQVWRPDPDVLVKNTWAPAGVPPHPYSVFGSAEDSVELFYRPWASAYDVYTNVTNQGTQPATFCINFRAASVARNAGQNCHLPAPSYRCTGQVVDRVAVSRVEDCLNYCFASSDYRGTAACCMHGEDSACTVHAGMSYVQLPASYLHSVVTLTGLCASYSGALSDGQSTADREHTGYVNSYYNTTYTQPIRTSTANVIPYRFPPLPPGCVVTVTLTQAAASPLLSLRASNATRANVTDFASYEVVGGEQTPTTSVQLHAAGSFVYAAVSTPGAVLGNYLLVATAPCNCDCVATSHGSCSADGACECEPYYSGVSCTVVNETAVVAAPQAACIDLLAATSGSTTIYTSAGASSVACAHALPVASGSGDGAASGSGEGSGTRSTTVTAGRVNVTVPLTAIEQAGYAADDVNIVIVQQAEDPFLPAADSRAVGSVVTITLLSRSSGEEVEVNNLAVPIEIVMDGPLAGTSCRAWNGTAWSSAGIVMATSAVDGRAVCLTTHLTTFTLWLARQVPQPNAFDVVQDARLLSQLDVTSMLALLPVALLGGFALLVLVLTWQSDRQRQSQRWQLASKLFIRTGRMQQAAVTTGSRSQALLATLRQQHTLLSCVWPTMSTLVVLSRPLRLAMMLCGSTVMASVSALFFRDDNLASAGRRIFIGFISIVMKSLATRLLPSVVAHACTPSTALQQGKSVSITTKDGTFVRKPLSKLSRSRVRDYRSQELELWQAEAQQRLLLRALSYMAIAMLQCMVLYVCLIVAVKFPPARMTFWLTNFFVSWMVGVAITEPLVVFVKLFLSSRGESEAGEADGTDADVELSGLETKHDNESGEDGETVEVKNPAFDKE